MQKNSVIRNEINDHKKWKWKILLKFLRKKSFRKKFFHSDFFFHEILQSSPIPRKRLDQLADCSRVVLENFSSRNGNLSPFEILAIASLIIARKPKRILEIGTFDGNTTLQMSLNALEDAMIHTIDLPADEMQTKKPVLDSDLLFIRDAIKSKRKFEDSVAAKKIRQHFGDSTQYDFSQFAKDGLLDFIFIDGGHSYECVRSDTENALKILNQAGCILWHDFTPHFGGVFRFLCELSQKLSLIHIEGTNLVFYENRGELQT